MLIDLGNFNATEHCKSCSTKCLSGLSRLRAKDINDFDTFKICRNFEPNDVIAVDSNEQTEFYCIQAGHLKLTMNNISIIRIYGPGDIIGYFSLANRIPSNEYSLVAIDSVKLCCFDKDLFQSKQDKSPEIANELLLLLAKEIEFRDERIGYLENHSVRNKVASALLSLNRKFGIPSDLGTRINVPIDRKTLAQLSGTVIESLSRTLTDLDQSKVIARSGKYIHIQNISRLQKIAAE